MTITGTNFTGATAVKFGDHRRQRYGRQRHPITATAPAGTAGTVDITVTTPGGTSATSANDQLLLLARRPSRRQPHRGPHGGGTTATITGTNLLGATAVKFGATHATFTIVSATQITATAPAEAAGTVDITVTTPGGTSATGADDQVHLRDRPDGRHDQPVSGRPPAGPPSRSQARTSRTPPRSISARYRHNRQS